MDNHIEEAKRLNIDAIKAEDRLAERHQETPRGPISSLIFA